MRDLKHRTLVASDNDVDKIIRTKDVKEVFLKVVNDDNLIILIMDNEKEYVYYKEPIGLFDSLIDIYASNLEKYMSEYVEINSYIER